MQICKWHAVSGPNIWSAAPVVAATIDTAGVDLLAADAPQGLADRLAEALPGLAEQGVAFLENLKRGLPAGEVVARVAVELQAIVVAGMDRAPALLVGKEAAGRHQIVVRGDDEAVTRACLQVACEWLTALVDGLPFETADALNHLRSTANVICIGPTTGEIVGAAKRRGIPTRRLDDGSLVLLGHGAKQHRIRMAVTDRTAAIPQDIAQDKELTKRLLRDLGVPVPRGRAVENPDDAWQATQEIGPPVVVKPRNANHGRGVSINLTTREQIDKAFAAAVPEGDGVLVEEFAAGAEHRLLVVDGKLVAASRAEPEQVVGDGVRTVAELVAELNADPRRGEDWASPLCMVELDAMALLTLEKQGFTVDSVPEKDATVLIHYNGEFLTDVTDEVHPATAAACELAARVIGLNIAGIDMIARDISKPPEGRNVRIIEVNSGPGLRMHFEPQFGKPRPVGDVIMAGLFAPDEDGRIPIVAILGQQQATQVAAQVRDRLKTKFPHVALVGREGLFVGERRLRTDRCDSVDGQRAALLHPDVEAAVCTTSAENVRRDGLGFDRAAVTVLLKDETDAEVRRVLIEATDAERGVVIVEQGDVAGLRQATKLGRRAVTAAGNDAASIAAAVDEFLRTTN
jgi:cyanophycin synthetase